MLFYFKLELLSLSIYIYKTLLSKATYISFKLQFFTFYQLLLSLGIEPMILALRAPCSTIWATGKLIMMKPKQISKLWWNQRREAVTGHQKQLYLYRSEAQCMLQGMMGLGLTCFQSGVHLHSESSFNPDLAPLHHLSCNPTALQSKVTLVERCEHLCDFHSPSCLPSFSHHHHHHSLSLPGRAAACRR